MAGRASLETLIELGRRVRKARKAQGLTQEAVAERAKLDYKYLQRIELGEVNVTIGTLERIAGAVGISVWRLIER